MLLLLRLQLCEFLTKLRPLPATNYPVRCHRRCTLRTPCVVEPAQLGGSAASKKAMTILWLQCSRYNDVIAVVFEVWRWQHSFVSGWLARGQIWPSEQNSDRSQPDRDPATHIVKKRTI